MFNDVCEKCFAAKYRPGVDDYCDYDDPNGEDGGRLCDLCGKELPRYELYYDLHGESEPEVTVHVR